MGRTWVAQHPHCMRCAYVTNTHSVYNAGTVTPLFKLCFYIDMSFHGLQLVTNTILARDMTTSTIVFLFKT